MQKVLKMIESGGVTILLGNGYNRYIRDIYKDDPLGALPPSWDDLVIQANASLKTGMEINRELIKNGGITNPELFTAVSLAYDQNNADCKHSILPVHRIVAELLEKSTVHCAEINEIQTLARRLKGWDIPVITTNYDKQLELCLGLNSYRVDGCPQTSSYYPVANYYSDKKLEVEDVDKHFAIWHCNGIVDYINSLRLDLGDYCNYTAWLKSCVPMYGGTVKRNDVFTNSWLWPFFNNNLVILGLGLDPSEFFLRWLLIRRAVWRKEEKKDTSKSYYICGTIDKIPSGQKAFLNSAGIEVLEYDPREQIYQELLGILPKNR